MCRARHVARLSTSLFGSRVARAAGRGTSRVRDGIACAAATRPAPLRSRPDRMHVSPRRRRRPAPGTPQPTRGPSRTARARCPRFGHRPAGHLRCLRGIPRWRYKTHTTSLPLSVPYSERLDSSPPLHFFPQTHTSVLPFNALSEHFPFAPFCLPPLPSSLRLTYLAAAQTSFAEAACAELPWGEIGPQGCYLGSCPQKGFAPRRTP